MKMKEDEVMKTFLSSLLMIPFRSRNISKSTQSFKFLTMYREKVDLTKYIERH